MRIVRLLLLSFLLLPLPGLCHAVRAAKDYDGVIFAKYLYNGYPVWSDFDRDEIFAHASTSSKTVVLTDFTDISLTNDEIALTTSTLKCFFLN